MTTERKIDSCLDINRRMPPLDVNNTLDNLIYITEGNEDIESRLCTSIDCPLTVADDEKAGGKKYIKCDYNRDGDSWRSPWTNNYYPALPDDVEDPFMPSVALRNIEEQCNKACDTYRDLYFQGGVSSVYCWDIDEAGQSFACCWCVVKDVKVGDIPNGHKLKQNKKADLHWSEIHVFEVTRKAANKHDYKLTSTVLVHIDKVDKSNLAFNLSGSRTNQRQATDIQTSGVESHVKQMGRMAEATASTLLSSINNIYFGKMNEVMSYLHQNQKDKNKGMYDSLAKDLRKTLNTAPPGM